MSIRLLRAFTRVHWRLLVNGLKSGGRRGALEQASRWLTAALPALLAIVMTPVVLAMAAGGVFAGFVLGSSPQASVAVSIALATALAIPLMWVVIRPLLPHDATGAEQGGLVRLLPVPVAFLYRLELASVLLDPIVVLFAPGVALIAVGTAAAGHFALAGFVFFASIAFLAAIVGFGALAALGARLLLRDRRRGEVVMLVVFLALSTVGILPQLFMAQREHRPAWVGRIEAARVPFDAASVEARIPAVFRVLPSGLFGLALGHAGSGNWTAAFLRLAALGGLAALTITATVPLHRRLLETPASGSAGTTRAGSRTAAGRRIPLITPATAAVAAATLRLLLRTVRGRMLLLSPPAFAVLLSIMATRQAHGGGAFFFAPFGVAALVMMMTVTAVQGIASNQFAIAGRGLVLELLLPLPPRAMVRGRALALFLVLLACLTLAILPLAAILHSLPAWIFPTLLAGGVAVHLALAAPVTALAAVLPKTADLSAMGKAGNPHPAANLLTFLAAIVAAVPPVGLTLLAARVLGNGWLAPLLVTGWAVVCGALAWAALPVGERLILARRENLALIAAGR